MRAVEYVRLWPDGERYWWSATGIDMDHVMRNCVEDKVDLSVRYDNGQLCTFRRKSPPQGGEG